MTDLDYEGKFVWDSDDEESNYTKWKYGEPNNFEEEEDCVILARHDKTRLVILMKLNSTIIAEREL